MIVITGYGVIDRNCILNLFDAVLPIAPGGAQDAKQVHRIRIERISLENATTQFLRPSDIAILKKRLRKLDALVKFTPRAAKP